jgi:hypothetical protein
MTPDKGWHRPFDNPITLPDGHVLGTLREATEWQAAMEALILVAEHDGPMMFARIGMMRALNRHVECVFDPTRKNVWRKAMGRT